MWLTSSKHSSHDVMTACYKVIINQCQAVAIHRLHVWPSLVLIVLVCLVADMEVWSWMVDILAWNKHDKLQLAHVWSPILMVLHLASEIPCEWSCLLSLGLEPWSCTHLNTKILNVTTKSISNLWPLATEKHKNTGNMLEQKCGLHWTSPVHASATFVLMVRSCGTASNIDTGWKRLL